MGVPDNFEWASIDAFILSLVLLIKTTSRKKKKFEKLTNGQKKKQK